MQRKLMNVLSPCLSHDELPVPWLGRGSVLYGHRHPGQRYHAMILIVLFWILAILCAIGYFLPDPRIVRASNGVLLILIAILGWKVFGSPLN